MKKLLSLFFGFALVFSLAGCGISVDWGGDEEEEAFEPEMETDVEDMEEAGEEMEMEEEVEGVEEEEAEEEPAEEPEEEEEAEPEQYSGANYITLKSPGNEESFHEEPIEFKGVVSPNTKKIVVTATLQTLDPNMPITDVYTLQAYAPGDTSFTYRAAVDWDNLLYGTNDYEFTAYFDDGTTESAYLTIYFQPATAEIGKPVIYLYPEKTTKVFVDVEPTGGISVSEPALKDGWNVVATPDSKIYNFADRGVYPYLFWEGFAYNFDRPEEGFTVAKDDVESFFNEKLAILGLNEVEIADFEEFWVPRLSEDPYYFITFISQEEFDNYAPLTVDPKPDSVIRVFFDYQGLDKKVEVKEQKLTTPKRDGFTVVEWGGRLYR